MLRQCTTRRLIMRLAALLSMSLVVTLYAAAEGAQSVASSYPTKAIQVIVPAGSGGGTDVTARALVKAAGSYVSKPLVVVNKPGGSTTLGTAYVAHAKADGYTILFAPSGPLVSQPHLLKNIDYKDSDFVGVLTMTSQPIVIAVRAQSPWKTLSDLMQEKTNGTVIKGGNAGVATIPGLIMKGFFASAGLKNRVIPFEGGAKTVAGLLSDSVDVITALPPEVEPYVESGQVRILAVSSAQRDPLLPNVPTFKEEGINLVGALHDFILVPKSTPEKVISYLYNAFSKAANSETFKTFLKNEKEQLQILNGSQTMQLINSDYKTFGEIIAQTPNQ